MGSHRVRRETWPAGVPVLTEGAMMLAAYLTAERELGRVAADADTGTLGVMLIGAGHLLFADRTGRPPQPTAIRRMVAGVLRDPGS